MRKKKTERNLDKLVDMLIAVTLTGAMCREASGFRVGRIIEAIWDDETKQVTKLVIRLYGPSRSGRASGSGYDGRKVTITERRSFAYSRVHGLIVGKTQIPIDYFVLGAATPLAKPKSLPVPPRIPEKPVVLPKPKGEAPKRVAPESFNEENLFDVE